METMHGDVLAIARINFSLVSCHFVHQLLKEYHLIA